MSAREGTRRAPLSLGAAVVILGCYVVAGGAAAVVPGLHGAGRIVLAGLLVASLAGVAAWFAAPRLAGPPPPRLADPPRRPLLPETERLARRLEFERQVDRALERATDPADVHALAARALGTLSPDAPSELLVVDGRRRQLHQVAEAGPDGEGPGCPVARPEHCEAIRRNRTLRWSSSDDLDACPFLAQREATACSAVCIPIRVVGAAAGVLHRTAPVGEPATDFEVDALESLTGRIETRLSVVHLAADDTADGVAPDEHGIVGRTGLERTMAALLRSLDPFAIARCDVADLEGYRARHGARSADQALRCFEATIVRHLRPGDTVGRVGPHELLAVLPDASVGDARRALDRIREEVVLAFAQRGLPPLTLAFGAVHAHAGQRVDDLLEAADAASTIVGPGSGGRPTT